MDGKEKTRKRIIRHKRVRAKISGTGSCPRVSVFRSNRQMIIQLFDDENNKSILQMGESVLSDKKKITKVEKSRELGKKFAEAAIKKNIKKVVFDRGGYAYHGRVMAVAEGLREGGLII